MMSKFFLVLGLFFTLVLFITVKEIGATKEPSLLFSESSKTVNVGETFEVEVIVDTAGELVYGVGAKIRFEPQILEVVSIAPGTIFGDYPVASYDNTSGKIIVSGIASSKNNYFRDNGVFATLTFRAKNQGVATVQFIYEEGSTTDSNIAVIYGTGDILSQVGVLSVSVSPGTGGLASTSVSDEPQSQVPKRVSFLTRLLRFFGLSREPGIREGRPVSGSIDAYDPIPSQSPITDANQKQPLSIIGSAGDSLIVRIAKIFLVIVLVIGIALLVKRFLLKSRKRGATVYQNVNISEDDQVWP